eukprot:COSAG02_NODE_4999_length_4733_cov_33.523522_3_plen_44_part_00
MCSIAIESLALTLGQTGSVRVDEATTKVQLPRWWYRQCRSVYY